MDGAVAAGDPIAVLPVLYHLLWRQELAADLSRLSELRQTLRERISSSPLMNAPRYARNVHAAYREMWRRWCST